MYSEDILRHQKLVTTETNFTSIVVSEVKPEQVKTDNIETKPLVLNLSLSIVILSCVICFILLSKSGAATREDLENIIKITRFSQTPCRKCRFFSNNLYLKCAVHPTIVLTKKANDCADYNPRRRRFLS